ncbi:MAG: inositol monophosphatase [Haloferacaceae archaeon]
MNDADAARRAAVAARAAADAGDLAAGYVDAAVETKSTPTDFVTDADHAAQDRVLAALGEAFPGEPVVGEEEGTDPRLREAVPETGPAWVVDPIDGTTNYVRGLPTWGCAVACVVDRDPVAAAVVEPELGRRYVGDAAAARLDGTVAETSDLTDPREATVVPFYWWGHDERDAYSAGVDAALRRFDDVQRLGCAQASLASVADGGLAGVFTDRRVASWDSVAGVHLVRLAGGRVTDLDGERWTVGAAGLVASNGSPAVHEALTECATAARAAAGD